MTYQIAYSRHRPQIFDYGEPDTKPVSIIGRVVWYCLPFDWHFGTDATRAV